MNIHASIYFIEKKLNKKRQVFSIKIFDLHFKEQDSEIFILIIRIYQIRYAEHLNRSHLSQEFKLNIKNGVMISSEILIIIIYFLRNQPIMIIKLSKAEVKDRFKDGNCLQVTLNLSGNIFKTKSPRKIRQRVANFYGEAIQLPISKNSILFYVDQIDQKGEKNRLMEICFESEERKRKQVSHDIMINQNNHIKLFWSWQLQVPESQMSSEFSRDIMNIETPKKADTSEWNDILRTYSPENKKKQNLCQLFLDQSMSEKCDSSPQTKKRLNIKQQSKQLTILKLTSLVKSKSAATRSKTPSKPDLPIKLKTPQNKKMDEHKTAKYYKNRTTISPQKKFRKVSAQKKNNYNINKMGAAIVSTFGIFAGLFAGMAASSI